jgi:hypothetical protein
VRKLARRLAIMGLSTVTALTIFGSPAHAANTFTGALACNNDFGGTWAYASDGHRAIKNVTGTQVLADIYLLYNSATGRNCVATIKRVSVGTATYTNAQLEVQHADGTAWSYSDTGNYKNYAATQADAGNLCVRYAGGIKYNGGLYVGGRNTWGNCG